MTVFLSRLWWCNCGCRSISDDDEKDLVPPVSPNSVVEFQEETFVVINSEPPSTTPLPNEEEKNRQQQQQMCADDEEGTRIDDIDISPEEENAIPTENSEKTFPIDEPTQVPQEKLDQVLEQKLPKVDQNGDNANNVPEFNTTITPECTTVDDSASGILQDHSQITKIPVVAKETENGGSVLDGDVVPLNQQQQEQSAEVKIRDFPLSPSAKPFSPLKTEPEIAYFVGQSEEPSQLFGDQNRWTFGQNWPSSSLGPWRAPRGRGRGGRNFQRRGRSAPSFGSRPPSTRSQCYDCQVGKEQVSECIASGHLVLVLLRGVPGSGKSTLAKDLKSYGEIFSTDEFFLQTDGTYAWNSEQLGEAHTWNFQRAVEAMESGLVTPVIIDNTNVRVFEMRRYALSALNCGYEIYCVEPETEWKFDAVECAKRTVHSVPVGSIERMLEWYVRDVTVDMLTKPPPRAAYQSQTQLAYAALESDGLTRRTTTKPAENEEPAADGYDDAKTDPVKSAGVENDSKPSWGLSGSGSEDNLSWEQQLTTTEEDTFADGAGQLPTGSGEKCKSPKMQRMPKNSESRQRRDCKSA